MQLLRSRLLQSRTMWRERTRSTDPPQYFKVYLNTTITVTTTRLWTSLRT